VRACVCVCVCGGGGMEVYVEKGAACQSIGCGGRPQSPSGHKRCTWGGKGTPRANII
jgi:hypothetical protein